MIDADLQDPPEEISKLLQKWREGYEVCLRRPAKTARKARPEKVLLLGLLPADGDGGAI